MVPTVGTSLHGYHDDTGCWGGGSEARGGGGEGAGARGRGGGHDLVGSGLVLASAAASCHSCAVAAGPIPLGSPPPCCCCCCDPSHLVHPCCTKPVHLLLPLHCPLAQFPACLLSASRHHTVWRTCQRTASSCNRQPNELIFDHASQPKLLLWFSFGIQPSTTDRQLSSSWKDTIIRLHSEQMAELQHYMAEPPCYHCNIPLQLSLSSCKKRRRRFTGIHTLHCQAKLINLLGSPIGLSNRDAVEGVRGGLGWIGGEQGRGGHETWERGRGLMSRGELNHL